jgi:hypothetical protein
MMSITEIPIALNIAMVRGDRLINGNPFPLSWWRIIAERSLRGRYGRSPLCATKWLHILPLFSIIYAT